MRSWRRSTRHIIPQPEEFPASGAVAPHPLPLCDLDPAAAAADEHVRRGTSNAPARTALIHFAEAGQAGRRIAGVAAAARIARELAEAGFAEAWIELPPGERLDEATVADLRRLAPELAVRIVAAGEAPAREAVRLDGGRLVPAALLAAGAAPGASARPVIRLDAPDAARAILRGTGKSGDGPVSAWLNRPISRRISLFLLAWPGVRPVHASAGTALLALLMAVSLLAGGEAGLIAGAILFHAASVFDGVDGEIARATFRSSPSGAMLDSVIDQATNLLFVVGVAINLTLAGHEAAPLLGGWGISLFAIGLALIAWRAARAAEPFGFDMVKRHYLRRFAGRAGAGPMRFLTIVTGRDFYALLFMVLALTGAPMAVLLIFAAAATIWILFVLGATVGAGSGLGARRA